MKQSVIIITLLVFCNFSWAQFNGSNGDGYSSIILSGVTLDNTNLVVLFNGSNGDGYTSNNLENTTLDNTTLNVLYMSGNGDGFSKEALEATTLQNTSLVILYSSGNGDGYANNQMAGITLDNTNLAVLFNGSNGDGFSLELLNGSTLNNQSLAAIYSGGNGDGYALQSSLKNVLSGLNIAFIYNGGNGDGFDIEQITDLLDPNQIVDLKISAKVFLQGPLLNPINGNLMNDYLRNDGKLPSTSPYLDAVTVANTVFNDGGTSGLEPQDNNIVDWVWIEIRDANDVSSIINDRSALLQRDGDIVDLDGISPITIEGVTDNYYVVVKHRNHMGIMSQSSIALSSNNTTVNFSNGQTQTYGTNAQALLANGSLALWAGKTTENYDHVRFLGANNNVDVIKDFILADPTNILNFITFTSSGYHSTDVDLNGFSKFSGADDDSNLIKDIILIHPGNILNIPTFQINATVPPNN